MLLIKKLPAEKDKNGKWQSYGLFLCLNFCNKMIIRRMGNGLKAKSCGCIKSKLISEIHKDKIVSENTRQKMSMSHIGKKQLQETINKRIQKNKGQKRTLEQRQKISVANKDKKRTEEQNKKQSERMFGIKYMEERKQKMSISHTGKHIGNKNCMYGKKGELSSNWNNGSSFEPYSPEFNKDLKGQILNRDNYTCQNPNCEYKSNKLDIHHIDYDKKNNNTENLVTLCKSCHSKTNGKNNRQFWTEFYQNIMINRIVECFL